MIYNNHHHMCSQLRSLNVFLPKLICFFCFSLNNHEIFIYIIQSCAFNVKSPHAARHGDLQILSSSQRWSMKEAIYGLTEILREEIKNARLVDNPGCYPTSIQLPLVPLIKALNQCNSKQIQKEDEDCKREQYPASCLRCETQEELIWHLCMVCVESVSLWQLTDFWETMEIALLTAENFTEFSLNTQQFLSSSS
ncbi:N-acetyl-gamma-glutamyl-phosphate reductase [Trifolium repens]|nr:N-acetyl-gamma-glutamyl-phosphate reductase [Trifolium repens]